ncbi:hypothetical protein DRE_02306 [Drechslerella stenobrocha 248]|uniref:Phospholipid-transporting ATPase n=1 Tax=Drechslerella stenobrocha 248 TaxID=1043628 RepID=W7I7X2_9PEZI|nr:hypothetical protein DRE_02306 [Drechslerella stenobrocha 248]
MTDPQRTPAHDATPPLTGPGNGDFGRNGVQLGNAAAGNGGDDGRGGHRRDPSWPRQQPGNGPSDDDATQKTPLPVAGDAPLRRKNHDYKKQYMSTMDRVRAPFITAAKFVLRMQDLPPSKAGRKIPFTVFKDRKHNKLVDERSGKIYVNNAIRSSRYSIWSFLPKQLIYQFSKLANFYFLVIGILQLIPSLSTTGRLTTIVPLSLFVSFSMAKEGYDDFRRYRQDRKENKRVTRVLSLSGVGPDVQEEWDEVIWEDVRVGDIVKLERNDMLPADILLLQAESDTGVAYVETSALDGESNLKGKQALPLVSENFFGRFGEAKDELATVEDPNADLYNFEGKIQIGSEVKPLTNAQILYRGSVLRNTPSAIGLAIFTGEETKIRMNANKRPRAKFPRLQTSVNYIILFIMLVVIFISGIELLGYKLWQRSFERNAWYLEGLGVGTFPILASFIIMFNTLIPLSLYVSLEIIKIGQHVWFFDDDMYDKKSKTPMEARTSTINEELGQISFIFSDKTGTLTENSMIFRKMTVAGYPWTHVTKAEKEQDAMENKAKGTHVGADDHKKGKSKAALPWKPQGISDYSSLASDISHVKPPTQGDSRMQSGPAEMGSKASMALAENELSTEELLKYIQLNPGTPYADKAKMFLLCLALCHTCLPEKDADGNITYQSSSPDEVALVQAAQELGYINVDRQVGSATINTYPDGPDSEPSVQKYEILEALEFTSKRKRMSIILRCPDGRICLFSKGADSTMTGLLRLRDMAIKSSKGVEKRNRERKTHDVMEFVRRTSMAAQSPSPRRTFSLSSPRPSWAGPRRSLSRRQGRGTTSAEQAEGEWPLPQQPDRPSQSFEARRSPATGHHRTVFESTLNESAIADDMFVFDQSYSQIHEFAVEGLRTLIYAYRFLDEDYFQDWARSYNEATTSLVDRQLKIEKAADTIEHSLEFAGATAIEDKLQDGVPDAIDRLRRAGIKLWMLTGDKKETAINIGYSCHLITDVSEIMIVDQDAGDLETQIRMFIEKINSHNLAHSVGVVDGATLAVIEDSEELSHLFFEFTVNVDSVVCCRASPNQKAGLVRSIRKKVNKAVTLAIGDGGNDIAMIQEAQVGVGITGKEGLAAARSSDYSIAQFRFLLKLLLCHGRWNYVRTCKYILGTFWKEILFYIVQAMYQVNNGYSGTSLYEEWSLALYNVFFSSLAIIFLGIMEKDLEQETLLAVPELYIYNKRTIFNMYSYLGYVTLGVGEAALIWYTSNALYNQSIICPNLGIYSIGSLIYTIVVFYVNTKLQFIEQHNITIVAVIVWLITICGWFLWNTAIIGYGFSTWTIYYRPQEFVLHIGRDLLWWTVVLLVLGCCLIFELSVKAIKTSFFPNEVDHFQAIQKDPVLKKKLEHAAYTENCNFFEEINESHMESNANSEVLKEIIQRRRESRFAYVRLGSKKARRLKEAAADDNYDGIELENREPRRDVEALSESSAQARGSQGSRWDGFRR